MVEAGSPQLSALCGSTGPRLEDRPGLGEEAFGGSGADSVAGGEGLRGDGGPLPLLGGGQGGGDLGHPVVGRGAAGCAVFGAGGAALVLGGPVGAGFGGGAGPPAAAVAFDAGVEESGGGVGADGGGGQAGDGGDFGVGEEVGGVRALGERRDRCAGEVGVDLGGVVEEGAGGSGQGLYGGGESGVVVAVPGGAGDASTAVVRDVAPTGGGRVPVSSAQALDALSRCLTDAEPADVPAGTQTARVPVGRRPRA